MENVQPDDDDNDEVEVATLISEIETVCGKKRCDNVIVALWTILINTIGAVEEHSSVLEAAASARDYLDDVIAKHSSWH